MQEYGQMVLYKYNLGKSADTIFCTFFCWLLYYVQNDKLKSFFSPFSLLRYDLRGSECSCYKMS